jgi:glycosyltransferase involved in cell wall biosynthesis
MAGSPQFVPESGVGALKARRRGSKLPARLSWWGCLFEVWAEPTGGAMRIGMFAWESEDSIPVTAVASHISGLSRTLAARGHEVHVITRRAEGQPEDETLGGVHWHRPSFELLPDFIEEIQGMCRSFVRCLDEVERQAGPVEILHAHDWTTCNAGVWAAEDRDAPLTVTLHSIESARVGRTDLDPVQARVAAHEESGCAHAARVITVAHSLRRQIMERYGVPEWRSEVVYNGVDLQRFAGFVDPGAVKSRYGLGPLVPMVLFPGPLEYRFGPDLLLEAMPAVLRERPELAAVFAGDGPMREDLQRRADELGLAEAIRWAPAADRTERVDLVCAADAICSPGRNDPFSPVVLQAWAAAKPVVVSLDGGPGEYVWHDVNGVQVHPRPDAVAWGIAHLFADFEWARWVGRNGRAAAETAFTWDRAAAHTEEVYQRARMEAAQGFSV